MVTWQEKCLKIIHGMGWSQRHFAERVGLKPSTLSHYLNDETDPPLEAAIRIAESLGLSLDALYLSRNEIDLNRLVVPAVLGREVLARRKVREKVLKVRQGRKQRHPAPRRKKAGDKD